MRLRNLSVKRKARIEIIPLIDIIFFLLATFVVVSLSMIRNTGVPVHLPASTTAVPQDRKQAVTLSVTRTGEIFLDQHPVSREDLAPRLSAWKAGQTDPQVFIHGDEEASLKHLMFVMDTVRTLGIVKVAMQTRPAVSQDAARN